MRPVSRIRVRAICKQKCNCSSLHVRDRVVQRPQLITILLLEVCPRGEQELHHVCVTTSSRGMQRRGPLIGHSVLKQSAQAFELRA